MRIPTSIFKHNRKQKRIWEKNKDLEIAFVSPSYTDEYFNLYARYISERHNDGDMHPPSPDQFRSFLLSKWSHTYFLEFRLKNELVAVAVTDILNNGFSAVYTFYSTPFLKRSLGVYAILKQIEEAKNRNLEYVFLGYWIKACKKMNYKSEFKPFEVYVDNQWQLI